MANPPHSLSVSTRIQRATSAWDVSGQGRSRQFIKQALLLMSSMTSLDAEIMSKLAASLERAIRVALWNR
jgi:hypothetical protein